MSEKEFGGEEIINRAGFILSRMELNWKLLDGRKVLDVGAGEAVVAQAGKVLKSTAEIHSVDVERSNKWVFLPGDIKEKTIQAKAEELPYKDNTFDLIINHASVSPLSIRDEVRVLKPGGEIRIAPIGGQTLEMWNIVYFLTIYRNWSPEKAHEYIAEVEKFIDLNDGARPEEYARLEEETKEMLSKEEKLYVIDSLVQRYGEVTGFDFRYRVMNPDDPEPNGYMVYKKPEIGYLLSDYDSYRSRFGQRPVLPFKTTPEGLDRETMLGEASLLAGILNRKGNIERVAIAGSLARGREHPSDIDLVLFLKNEMAHRYFKTASEARKSKDEKKPDLFDYLGISDDDWNVFVSILMNTQSAVDLIIVSNQPDEEYAKMMSQGNIDPYFLLNLSKTAILYDSESNSFKRSGRIYSERQIETVNEAGFKELKRLVENPKDRKYDAIYRSHSHQKRINR